MNTLAVVVKSVVGNSCGSVCQDFGSLLHLDMFNSHPCAKSEILLDYINKVHCFAFWASSTHSQKIYIYICIYNVLWMKTGLVLEYCIRMDSGDYFQSGSLRVSQEQGRDRKNTQCKGTCIIKRCNL